MPTLSKRLLVCLALLLGLCGAALGFLGGPQPFPPHTTPVGQPTSPERNVAPSTTMFRLGQEPQATRRLPRSAIHRYSFSLRVGEFLEVAVDQDPVRGAEIDLACRVYSPKVFLYEVDSPNDARGSEFVRIVAVDAGEYQIDISGGNQTGIYRVRQTALRPADARDRIVARAEEFFYQGRALGKRKEYPRAMDSYRMAQSLWHSIKSQEGEAAALDRAAALNSDSGDWTRAESLWSQALRIRLASHDLREATRSLMGKGEANWRLGKIEQAEESLREALRLGSQLGDPTLKANALRLLAAVTGAGGDELGAYELFQQALPLWKEAGRTSEEFDTLNSMGNIHLSLGNVESAQRFYHRAEKLLDQLGDDERAQVYSRFCGLYTRLRNFDLALVYGQKAVALRKKANNFRGQAVSLADVATAYGGKKDFARSRAARQDALALYRRVGDKYGECISYYHLGLIFLNEKSLIQARERFGEALTKAQEMNYAEGQILALYGLALVERARGNLRESRRWVDKALPLIEYAPQNTGDDDNAPVAVARQGSYELLIDTLVSNPPSFTTMGDRAASFAVTERARWRSLREWLSANQDPSFKRARSDPRGRRLVGAQPKADETEAQPMEGEISGGVGEQTALVESIRMHEATIQRKAAWSAASASPSFTLAQAQALLDSDTILLVYFLGTGRSYLWMVTPTTVDVFALPDRELIEEKCREFYGLLSASSSRSREESAAARGRELSRILLGAVADKLGDKRLVIVRDGLISNVPFAALTDPSPGAAEWSGHGPAPLVFQHEIVYLPSASVLLALRNQSRSRVPAKGLMAVVADPVFAPEMYQPLPYSRREGKRLSSLAAKQGKVLSVYGFDAARDFVMSGKLSDFRYLVFATHGLNDPLHPEFSSLVLSQRTQDGRARQGLLSVQDIKNLEFKSDLVFLSGCRTSLGSPRPGEGFLGLTQSFMYAGVPRVIASLWILREDSAPDFSEHVFRSILLEGASPAKSLRDAQIWMAQQPEWRSPYFWAGYEIQGDWR